MMQFHVISTHKRFLTRYISSTKRRYYIQKVNSENVNYDFQSEYIFVFQGFQWFDNIYS